MSTGFWGDIASGEGREWTRVVFYGAALRPGGLQLGDFDRFSFDILLLLRGTF